MGNKYEDYRKCDHIRVLANFDAPRGIQIEATATVEGQVTAGAVSSFLLRQEGVEDEDEFAFSIKERSAVSQGISRRMVIYTRATISFETNLKTMKFLREYFENHSNIEEVMLLENSQGITYVGPLLNDIDVIMNGSIIVPGEIVEKKETQLDEKNDLKAYETPSNVFDILFEQLDRQTFQAKILEDVYSYLVGVTKGKKSTMDNFIKWYGGKGWEETMEYGFRYLIYEAMFSEEGKNRVMSEAEHEGINTKSNVNDFIGKFIEGNLGDERFSETLAVVATLTERGREFGYMQYAGSKEGAQMWKDAFRRSIAPATIPVFDPQAGSGVGLLKGMDNTNFYGTLQGFELRNTQNDDPRYNVLTGVNLPVHTSTIAQLMAGSYLQVPADNLFSYINPPYSSDDSVAKETIEMFRNGMMISGLFPTKLKNFLLKSLNGSSIIVQIPRELTGYTDPKTPENFLFVMGEKYSSFSGEGEAIQDETLLTQRTAYHTPKFFTATSKEKLDKILNVHFVQYNGLGNAYKNMHSYYSKDEKRQTRMIRSLHDRVLSEKNMLENSEKIFNTIQGRKKEILNKFTPIEAAKKQKLFQDMRFYSQSGNYQKYRFVEIAGNIPLLTYYRDRAPQVFNLVKEVADSLEIKLPVSTDPAEPFRFTERYEGEKDKVTNKSLGMMRLYYYPSNIDLSDEENKKILYDLILSIRPEMQKKDKIMLNKAIQMASNMVIKSKTTINQMTATVMPSDTFILTNEFGFDIGELNFELDELYTAMEEHELFSINDYIELAQLSPEKMRALMEAFVKDMGHTIAIIARHNKVDAEMLKEEIYATGKMIESRRREKNIDNEEIRSEIFKLAEKYNFKKIFTSMFRNDQPKFKRAVKNLTQHAFGRILSATECVKISNSVVDLFNQNPIAFHEDHLHDFIDHIEDELNRKAYAGKRETLDRDILKFREAVQDALVSPYEMQIAVVKAYSRMSDILLRYYAPMRNYLEILKDTPENNAKLFAAYFRRMFISGMGLKPHQFNEAERYLAIENDATIEQLFWEMRSGKTRSFIATSYLLGMYKNKNINIVLETANMPDISLQMFESFPFLTLRSIYIVDDTKINIDPQYVIDMLPTTQAIPNPFRLIAQSRYHGGGEMAETMTAKYGKLYDDTQEAVRKRFEGMDPKEMIAQVINENKDSPLAGLLQNAGCGE